jgi:hypothetical protein
MPSTPLLPLFLSQGRHNRQIPQHIPPTCAATVPHGQDLVEKGCGMKKNLPGCTEKKYLIFDAEVPV